MPIRMMLGLEFISDLSSEYPSSLARLPVGVRDVSVPRRAARLRREAAPEMWPRLPVAGLQASPHVPPRLGGNNATRFKGILLRAYDFQIYGPAVSVFDEHPDVAH